MHRAMLQKIMHAHEGPPPPTTVIRFTNLLSLVFLGKNKVGYFLDRPCIMTLQSGQLIQLLILSAIILQSTSLRALKHPANIPPVPSMSSFRPHLSSEPA
jgi:hypothetical protein